MVNVVITDECMIYLKMSVQKRKYIMYIFTIYIMSNKYNYHQNI